MRRCAPSVQVSARGRSIVTTAASSDLGRAAAVRSFESPLWVTTGELKFSTAARGLSVRGGERAIHVNLPLRQPYYNASSMSWGPVAESFLSEIGLLEAMLTIRTRQGDVVERPAVAPASMEPIHVQTLQAFEGPQRQAMRALSAMHQLGPLWGTQRELAARGFVARVGAAKLPSFTAVRSRSVGLFNLSQLSASVPGDTSVANPRTWPVHGGSGYWVIHTRVGEALWREARRRCVLDPIVATAATVESRGCSIRPDAVGNAVFAATEGWSKVHAPGSDGATSTQLYSLDDFFPGSDAIAAALHLPPTDVPRYLTSGAPIAGALVRQTAAMRPPSSESRYSYWLTKAQADALAAGRWVLQPSAVPAVVEPAGATHGAGEVQPGSGAAYYFSEDVLEREDFVATVGMHLK